LCRNWADDGCEHINEFLEIKPEFLAQVHELERQEREAEDALVAEIEEGERLAAEYDRARALCPHRWVEQPGEPPFDACPDCGATRE